MSETSNEGGLVFLFPRRQGQHLIIHSKSSHHNSLLTELRDFIKKFVINESTMLEKRIVQMRMINQDYFDLSNLKMFHSLINGLIGLVELEENLRM